MRLRALRRRLIGDEDEETATAPRRSAAPTHA
jgi:hypothetical protein